MNDDAVMEIFESLKTKLKNIPQKPKQKRSARNYTPEDKERIKENLRLGKEKKKSERAEKKKIAEEIASIPPPRPGTPEMVKVMAQLEKMSKYMDTLAVRANATESVKVASTQEPTKCSVAEASIPEPIKPDTKKIEFEAKVKAYNKKLTDFAKQMRCHNIT